MQTTKTPATKAVKAAEQALIAAAQAYLDGDTYDLALAYRTASIKWQIEVQRAAARNARARAARNARVVA